MLASDVYDVFEKRQKTLALALDLEDAYIKVDFWILMRTLKNMEVQVDLYLVMWIRNALL